MYTAERRRAIVAASAIASALGLVTEDAVILRDSNKLTLRLLPCDVLARVAPAKEPVAAFELDLARQLTKAGCPVGTPDSRVAPRVYERDGFATTFWTHYDAAGGELSAADYAIALCRLHAGLREVDVRTPHFTDRIDHAEHLLASPQETPALADADRELLASAVRRSRRAIEQCEPAEQLLHGEPHPGNLLATTFGLRFIDLETCCRGPVEFDLAHTPEEVADHYPSVDRTVLRHCRILVLAMITTWRWDRGDQLPDGRRLAAGWLREMQQLEAG